MFNKKDISLELAASMEQNLVGNTIEKHAEGLNKLATAIDHLNDAAETFDDLGLEKEAEVLTTLLEVLAGKKSKKKSKRKVKKTDPATKGLTADKMLSNLKEKGWVFNANDQKHDHKHEHAEKHSHGCMCSMCMDVNDVRHGDDCVCHICGKDDNNDIKNSNLPPGLQHYTLDEVSETLPVSGELSKTLWQLIPKGGPSQGEWPEPDSADRTHRSLKKFWHKLSPQQQQEIVDAWKKENQGFEAPKEIDYHKDDNHSDDDNYAEMFRSMLGDSNDFEDEV